MKDTRVDYKCSNCDLIDHDENHFCRCEGRNIKLAQQYRKDGINLWIKPQHKEIKCLNQS